MYDLYGGVLATGVPLEENRDRWKLEFRELDSLRRRGPNSDQVAHWSYEVALPLLEMALDPAQDLLILLAMYVPFTPPLFSFFELFNPSGPTGNRDA